MARKCTNISLYKSARKRTLKRLNISFKAETVTDTWSHWTVRCSVLMSYSWGFLCSASTRRFVPCAVSWRRLRIWEQPWRRRWSWTTNTQSTAPWVWPNSGTNSTNWAWECNTTWNNRSKPGDTSQTCPYNIFSL